MNNIASNKNNNSTNCVSPILVRRVKIQRCGISCTVSFRYDVSSYISKEGRTSRSVLAAK